MEHLDQKIKAYEEKQHRFTSKKDMWHTIWSFCDNRCKFIYREDSFFFNLIHTLLNIAIMIGIGYLTAAFMQELTFMIFILPVILYFALFFFGKILGSKKYDFYTNQLKDLAEEVNSDLDQYYQARCTEAGFPEGYLFFNNGIIVGAGGSRVQLQLAKNYGRMTLYMKDKDFRYSVPEELIMNMIGDNSGKVLLNDLIPAIAFNENFWVVAEAGTERNCLAYFSPAMQLNLIKKGGPSYFEGIIWDFVKMTLEHGVYSVFSIVDDQLVVDIEYKHAEGGYHPVEFNEIWGSKNIRASFNAVDRFCETFPDVALETAQIFDDKVGFLRGNII